MRKLFFGGAFNPIHHGHLICSRSAAEIAGFEQVVLVPTGVPAFKRVNADLAPARDRAAMCNLATVASPRAFVVDDIELHRPGPSYTFDTAMELRVRHGEPVTWLIGADTLPFLHRWHRAEELLATISFLVMARPGYPIEWSALSPVVQKLRDRIVTTPLIDISATQIRQRSARGEPIDFFTPPAVCQYIAEQSLYRDGPGR